MCNEPLPLFPSPDRPCYGLVRLHDPIVHSSDKLRGDRTVEVTIRNELTLIYVVSTVLLYPLPISYTGHTTHVIADNNRDMCRRNLSHAKHRSGVKTRPPIAQYCIARIKAGAHASATSCKQGASHIRCHAQPPA